MYTVYLSTVADFYFGASYPGDDFINVSDEELDICFDVMEEVYTAVNEWNRNNSSVSTLEVILQEAKK